VLLGNSAFSAAQERHYSETLANMRVDGLLLVRAEVAGRSSPRRVVSNQVPTVYLHHKAPKSVRATSVVLDNHAGGRSAVRQLLEHGYGSIGCLTGTARSGPVADRARGCAVELRDTGAAAGIVRTDLDRSRAHHDAREWLRQPKRPRALPATAGDPAPDRDDAA